MIRPYLLLLALALVRPAYAENAPAQQAPDFQALIRATVLPVMQMQKAERAAIAARCAEVSSDFRERYRDANAAWEARAALNLRFIGAAFGAMTKSPSASPDADAPPSIDIAEIVRAIAEARASSRLPGADNPFELRQKAEAKIHREMAVLNTLDRYEYCLKKLESNNINAIDSDSSTISP